jgi:hypothetical protein
MIIINSNIFYILDLTVLYRWIDAVGLLMIFEFKIVFYIFFSTFGGILDGIRGKNSYIDTIRFQTIILYYINKFIDNLIIRFNDEIFANVTYFLFSLNVFGKIRENIYIHSRVWARISRHKNEFKSLGKISLSVN